ncbi:MAG: thioredoxin domain-containing protein [Candidatus Dojkabacteria bacterium]|nr:MAG: thioredoxin domain-containing protein [Candidatus Dojkabacteria bacterium]
MDNDIASLQKKIFERALEQADTPVFVIFTASWSLSCALYQQELQDFEIEIIEKALIATLDIDSFPDLTEKYGIVTIPTTLVFFNKQIVKQLHGHQNPEILTNIVEELTTPSSSNDLTSETKE